MYNLIIKYNNQTIKSIIAYDCHRITGSGIEWVINAYQYYFNIDISEYSVKEIKLFEGGANLYI
jgi:hypothetical protein